MLPEEQCSSYKVREESKTLQWTLKLPEAPNRFRNLKSQQEVPAGEEDKTAYERK